jgi:transcription antitermination factor NusG
MAVAAKMREEVGCNRRPPRKSVPNSNLSHNEIVLLTLTGAKSGFPLDPFLLRVGSYARDRHHECEHVLAFGNCGLDLATPVHHWRAAQAHSAKQAKTRQLTTFQSLKAKTPCKREGGAINEMPEITGVLQHGALAAESAKADAERWYALYTRSRHEKSIGQQLAGKGIKYFLPLFEAVHRWKDRSVRVSIPLFPGYLFVRISAMERRAVVSVPGVVAMVGTHAGPSPIPDDELETLRICVSHQALLQPCPFLAVGRKGRIIAGPLAEVEGILLRRKGQARLVLSITLISRSVAVEVDAENVLALAPCRPVSSDPESPALAA